MSTRVAPFARSMSSSSISSILSSTSAESRPRLARQKKRVSFDATSSVHYTTSIIKPVDFSLVGESSTSGPSLGLTRRNSKEIDSGVDLRAVLAAGIVEWRTEVLEDVDVSPEVMVL